MWDIVLLYTYGYLVFKHNMVSQKVLHWEKNVEKSYFLNCMLQMS